MSALPLSAPTVSGLGRVRWAVSDAFTLVRRGAGRIRREPGRLVAAMLFPIISVVLFAYVFGSAIKVPGGGNYKEYLMPGLFVQSMVMGFLSTMMLTANDMDRGIIDRLRSMPLARSAVPIGFTSIEVINGVITLGLMMACGLAVGWRAHHGVADVLAGVGLLLLLRYALGWAGLYIGLVVGSPDTANSFFPLIFPVTMIANTFVPTDNMIGWMRAIAEWNPVSAAVAACRELFGNPGRAVAADAAWPLHHPLLATLCWSIGLLVVFVPLSVRRYRRLER